MLEGEVLSIVWEEFVKWNFLTNKSKFFFKNENLLYLLQIWYED